MPAPVVALIPAVRGWIEELKADYAEKERIRHMTPKQQRERFRGGR